MAWAFQKALAEQGISQTEEEILKHIKISMGHGIDFYKDKYNIDVKEFVDRYAKYEDSVDEGKVYPFEHVKEICSKVADMGGRNFIITHRDKTISRFIKYHGMAELFMEIVIKEHGFKRKPDPEAFTYILEKTILIRTTLLL
jgi:phosphoglycolate phosphatase-like HAD superfamily hydrolase